MWQCFLNFLEIQAPFISLATVILWGLYVLYTIRTFRSIHRQEEFQREAFLLVSYEITPGGFRGIIGTVGIPGTSGYVGSGPSAQNYPAFYNVTYPSGVPYREKIGKKMEDLYNKWHLILSKNIPGALQPEKEIILHLQNRGRSDIIQWKINLKAHVEPGKHLSQYIKGEECTWSIEGKSSKEIIAPSDRIGIVIGKTGVFPYLILSWTIEYKDMRDKPYTRFGGDNVLVDFNALTDPSTQSPSSPPAPAPPPAPIHTK